jgi:hypothetical protein
VNGYLQISKGFAKSDVEQVVQSLRGALLQPPLEFTAALNHLVQAGWVENREGHYWAHPQVAEGLTSLFEDAPERATGTLLVWMRGLLKSRYTRRALVLSFELGRRNQPILPDLEDELDAFLICTVLDAENTAFPEALDALGYLSRGNAPEAIIARRLVGPEGFPQGDFRWTASEWTPADRAAVRASLSARQIVARFIQHGWMKSHRRYVWERFSAWVEDLGWSFQEECLAATKAALGQEGWEFVQDVDSGTGSYESFEVSLSQLLQGALARPDAPVEEFLGLSIDALDRARNFVAKEEEALLEVEMSMVAGTLRGTQLAALPRPFQRALETVVDIRRRREGYEWVRMHPRREKIAPAFNASIHATIWPFTSSLPSRYEVRPKGTVEELIAIHEACGEDKSSVWTLMPLVEGKDEFLPLLLKDLQNCPLKYLRIGVSVLQRLVGMPEATRALSKVSAQADFVRRVAITEALKDNAPFQGLSSDERKIVELCGSTLKTQPPRAEFEALSQEQWPLLWHLAEQHTGKLGVGALLALAFSGEPLEKLTDLVGKRDDNEKLFMWGRLANEDLERVRSVLCAQLHHEKARFRRLALQLLAPTATAGEREEILQLADDSNPFVRKECAIQIGKGGWREGVSVLLGMLTRPPAKEAIDGRFAAQSAPIGRAAAMALAGMPRLEDTEFARCLDFVRRGPEAIPDLWVRCELVLLVARSSLEGCRETFEQCLESPEAHLEESRRRFPLRYAGAWGLFLHLRWYPEARSGLNLERLAKAAKHPDARLAGPCLLVLGLVAPGALGFIRDVFSAHETTSARALLLAGGAVMGGSPLPEDLLRLRVAEREPGLRLLQYAQQAQPPSAEDWAGVLRRNPDFSTWLDSTRQSVDVQNLLQWLIFEFLGRYAREGLMMEQPIPGTQLSAEESLNMIMEQEWRGKHSEWEGWW